MRNIGARVLFGGRVSLSVGVIAMLIAIGVGTTVGAGAGFLVLVASCLRDFVLKLLPL